jgi:MoaD family protein
MALVKFYSHLRRLTGLKEKNVASDSLRLVLEALERDFPSLGAYFNSSERGRLIITINGHPLDPAAGLEIPLAETDQIAIFPPISGG